MKDYTKKEIEEALTGEKQSFTNLKRRIENWDLALNQMFENLKWLHEEFNLIYEEVNKLGDAHESMEGQSRK